MLGERFVGQLGEYVGGVSKGFVPVSLRSEFFEYPGRKRIPLSLGKLGGFVKCLIKKFCHGSTSIYQIQLALDVFQGGQANCQRIGNRSA